MFTQKSTIAAALLAATSCIAISSAASAGEAEDALIEKVVDAYGGDRLTGMNSIRVQDVYRTSVPGQGYTSDYVEFFTQKQDAQLDLQNQRGSVEGWSYNSNFSFNTRTVSAEDDIVTINYATGNYQPAAQPDFHTAYGAVIRVTDTLLAYELAKNAETAAHQGETIYLGRPHEMLSFEMPASPPLTLYVDEETGRISKMTRETGFGALTYAFDDFKTTNGVGYASSFEFFVGPDVNIVTLDRDVTVNNVRPAVFRIDRGVAEEGERVDASEMTVDEIAEGVHHVGTGIAYTTFVDAGDHVIAVGGYAGLADRFAAYKETAGHDKPLRYQIVTHHHTDHLGGMADALELGAMFVTPANAVDNLATAAGADIPGDRLMVIEEELTLGPVEIHDIWTSHAESYAAVFIPSAGAVVQADHYNGIYVEDVAPAGIGSVTFKNAVDRLDWEPEVLLSAHGRKPVPWSEFTAAVEAYEPVVCAANRAICM